MGCCDKIAHGASGIAKAALGIDRVDGASWARRRAVCVACEHSTHSGGRLSRCKLCDCFIGAKIRVKGEQCPEGKW